MTAHEDSLPATWVFGYGSLIWRPDFDYAERRTGFVRDWARRFWQASIDHRGVPSRPGRVVTLIKEPGALCFGTAYRLREEDRNAVLEGLDHRERGGFIKEFLPVYFGGDLPEAETSISALVYVATERNPNYLGPAPLAAIASQVRASQGPSGPNLEYVLRLAEALRAMGVEDEHVFALEALLSAGE